MARKPTWNDINEATSSDLKRVYKLNDRQLEQAVRGHMDGITSSQQKRDFYEKVYNTKHKTR